MRVQTTLHAVQSWSEQENACIDIPPRCADTNACTDNSPRRAVMVRAGECVYNQHIHAWIKHMFPLFETDGGRVGKGGGGGTGTYTESRQ